MNRTSARTSCLPVALLLLAGALVPDRLPAAEREWYGLSIDGTRVGFGWIERSQESKHQLYSEVMRVEVTQLKKFTSIQSWREVIRSGTGLPERMEVGSKVGDMDTGWQGSFSPDSRVLSVRITGSDQRQTFNVPADLGLPDRLPEALMPLSHAGAQSLEFHYLDPRDAQPVTLRAERLSQPGEAVTKVLTVATVGQQRHEESLWFQSDGRIVHREQPFFGATLVWERCAANCASPVQVPYDLMSKLVVASPFRVPEAAFPGPIRYVIARTDGRPAKLPVTAEQAVAQDGAKAVVTVCVSCQLPDTTTAAEREQFLKPNAWVQSDAPEIGEFANRHGHGSSPAEIMNHLVEAVRDHMNGTVDYLGYATAVEAFRSRSGDCTEYAVLLAALARAKGIPTRIAYGLVYADRFSGKKDVFSPHAWVQSWTGSRWQSFDAGIGQFDATHLALRIGDGDPRAVDTSYVTPANIRIENLGRVR